MHAWCMHFLNSDKLKTTQAEELNEKVLYYHDSGTDLEFAMYASRMEDTEAHWNYLM